MMNIVLPPKGVRVAKDLLVLWKWS